MPLLTFFTISETDIGTMLGYVTDFIGDITPLLMPIIAIGLGILIVLALIRAFRG